MLDIANSVAQLIAARLVAGAVDGLTPDSVEVVYTASGVRRHSEAAEADLGVVSRLAVMEVACVGMLPITRCR